MCCPIFTQDTTTEKRRNVVRQRKVLMFNFSKLHSVLIEVVAERRAHPGAPTAGSIA